MRLTRPRFTVRRLMVAVAIVGVTLGVVVWCKRRHDRFAGLVSLYERERGNTAGIWSGPSKVIEARRGLARRRGRYFYMMATKYRFAACYPWLPVEPDPPEPPDPN
jgi:hypothetical protein